MAEHQSVDTFQTERLVAVPLRDEHFDEILRMHRDPKVMATLGGLRADDETARYLRDNLDHWNRYGYGIRSFSDRTAGRFVGRASLRNIRVGGNHEVELAYALMAQNWKRELAMEMAEAIPGVAFEKLSMTYGVCFTLRTTGRRGGSWRRRSSGTSATSSTRASRTCSTASPLGGRKTAIGGRRPGGGSLLKVIGAGFGRTGTLSLKAALEELGFGPCYHMTELFDKPDHIRFWDEAADEVARDETVGWEEVFSGYEATVDWPACIFYEELMQAYPDAKVLLSVRDPERWYVSAESTIARMPNSGAFSPQALLFKTTGLLVPSMRRAPSMAEKIISEGTFGGHFDDREHAVEVFERHNEEVKRRVPAEKLLVFEVREGWGPLCEFLGVEAPDKPFPHLNDREDFPRMMRRQIATALAPALGRTLVALSAVLAALLVLRTILPGSRRDQ